MAWPLALLAAAAASTVAAGAATTNGATTAATPAPLSFAAAIDRALHQNPDLAAARFALPLADANVQAAAALPNPTLGASVGPDEPTLSGSIEQRLPIFGQRSTAIAAARADVPVAQAELALRTLQLRASVRRAYASLAAAQSRVRLADDAARIAGDLATMTQQKYEIGSAPRLDAEQARVAFDRAQQDAEASRAELARARIELAAALGDDPSALLDACDPLEPAPEAPAPIDQLLAHLARHPEVESADREREAALARAARERAAVRPLPALTLELERLTPDPHPTLGVRGTIAFDVPVLSLNAGAVRAERVQAERASATRAAALRRLEAAVRTAHGRFQAAARRLRFVNDQLIPAAVHAAELARVAYDVGRTPLSNVLLAQSEVAAARSRATDTALEAWSALADLEEASGATTSPP